MKALFMLGLFAPFLILAQTAPHFQSDSNRIFLEELGVSIIPPVGFEEAHQYLGFINPLNNATIALAKSDTSNYVNYKMAFSPEYFESQDLTVLGKETVQVGEHEGELHHVSFNVKGFEFERYLLVIGDEVSLYIVVCNYMVATKPEMEPVLRSALLSFDF